MIDPAFSRGLVHRRIPARAQRREAAPSMTSDAKEGMQRIGNFIGGRCEDASGGGLLENFDPATGSVYSVLPDSDERDVERAVDAAEAAFEGWQATPAEERSRVMLRLADLMEARLEPLARAECIDAGKPIAAARALDIPRAIRNVRFFATAILHASSESYDNEGTALHYTLRRPLGVVGCISPWNLPLYLLTWKVAPAIAAGNCAVAKPSELTPMTAHLLGELCIEAGLPPGVLDIVHGRGALAGAALVAHPKVRAISFTGGTVTGAGIAREAAPRFKKLSLELGGKNPVLVFADCDYDAMLPATVRAAFSNQGQICLCGSRIFVERPLLERFRGDFAAAARALKPGDPLDPATAQGALISRAHREKVLSYIALAREEGGEILAGGGPAEVPGRCRDGWFVEPTVIAGLPPACRVNQEEVFGPLATIIPFDAEEEAVHHANGTPYGLAASVWTSNLGRAHRVAHRLQSGIIWINCWMLRDLRTPFGGTKSSGVGREGGFEALRFFTEPSSVTVKL
jgi:aminomuconate-semialdehyde/2-hydroxymuconate-6-semialdehyde dehydrogenase